ncbi:MAG: DUF1287 domain-containing protein [Hyphomicrobiaceae bacterium]
MKKPSRGKRTTQRSPHNSVAARQRLPAAHTPNPPASDITPAIALLLCLKASPSPAHAPSRHRMTTGRSAVATTTTVRQDDRATLALLSLPIVLMIGSLAITQSFKPVRRVDLAAAPATLFPSAALAPKPILVPSATPRLPSAAAPIASATSPHVSSLAASEPVLTPTLPSGRIATPSSPALAPANERTAMLTARPPAELDASPATARLPPIAAQDASLEPKLCTTTPVAAPVGNLSTTLTPAAFGKALATAARAQTHDFVIYNDKYRALSYPRGDVQPLYGVCTDVIIRAYRALGVDLQQLVHESRVGIGDTSIEHRRTETLRRFFARFGQQLPASTVAEDYLPGDVVTYDRPQNRGSRSHIALVSDVAAPSGRYMIVHNRGWGPQLEDGLFVDQITGHYRYTAPASAPLLANIPVISTPQKRPPALTRLAARPHRRLDGVSVNGLGR